MNLENNIGFMAKLQLLANNPMAIASWFAQFLNALGIQMVQNKLVSTFISASQKAIVGLTTQSFFGTQYPAGEEFLITHIRALSGANATLASTDWQPGVSDPLSKQGLISINNNGSDVLKDFPLTTFVLSTGNANDNDAWLELDTPILWRSQTTLTLYANFPAAITTANQNIRFELAGLKLI